MSSLRLSWHLKKQYFFGDVFWDMWLKLKHGEFTADRHIIYEEAMVIAGKTYAYFLPFPALVRGFFSIFKLGQYPIPSVLLAITIFLMSSLSLYRELIKTLALKTKEVQWLAAYIGGLLIIGSPLIMMLSYPLMFWEAIIWGAALFILCAFLSYSLLTHRPSNARLLVFSVICGLALFTRPTIVVATSALYCLTMVAFFIKHKPVSDAQAQFSQSKLFLVGISLILFGLFIVGLGVYNYLKWGSPFEFGNLKNYTLIWTQEYYETFLQSGHFQLDRFPEGFAFYFLPNLGNFTTHFPFIQFGGENPFLGFAKTILYREASLSFFITMPVFEIGFFSGILLFIKAIFTKDGRIKALWRNSWPIAVSTLIPMFVLLGWFAHSIRYSGDFIVGLFFFTIFTLCILLLKLDDHLQMGLHGYKKAWLAIFATLLAGLTLYLTLTTNLIERQAPLLRSLAYLTPPPPTFLNQAIFFNNSGVGPQYLSGAVSNSKLDNGGWSIPEAWGVWSNGKSAKLEFPVPVFPIPSDKPITLLIHFRAFINPSIPQQEVTVNVNGDLYKRMVINTVANNQLSITLPAPKKEDPKTQMRSIIEFILPDAKSPTSVGAGDDSRVLAIGLESAVFQQ